MSELLHPARGAPLVLGARVLSAFLAALWASGAAVAQTPLDVRLITTSPMEVEAGRRVSPAPQLGVFLRSDGNPAEGRYVVPFVVDAAEGVTVQSAPVRTSADGLVRLDSLVILAPEPRTVRIRFRVDGVDHVSPELVLEVRVTGPDRAQLLSQFPTETVSGAPLATPLTLAVSDARGDPAAGARIRLAASEALTLVGGTATTDPEGRAAFPHLVFTGEVDKPHQLRAEGRVGTQWKELWRTQVRLRSGPPHTIALTAPAPSAIRAGEPLATPLRVAVADAVGNPLAGASVQVQVTDPSWSVDNNDVTTDSNGLASFPNLRIHGTKGRVGLLVMAGTARSDTMTADVLEGRPRRVVILTQPPAVIIADSLFARTPRVRVEDGSGNVLSNQEVEARLCAEVRLEGETSGKGKTEARCEDINADLIGRRFKRSDQAGTITFDSLSVSGPEGKYYLEFTLDGCRAPSSECAARSTPMSYKPDWSLNRNYVAIGAIKSIAGAKPDNEFFDIRFRFRLSRSWVALASVDLALSSSTSTDSVQSSQQRLTEANAMVAWRFAPRKDPVTDAPERELLAGGVVKVFNTIPYAGVWLGAEELTGSAFEGSLFGLGVVGSLYETPLVVAGETIRPQKVNLLADFYIRSSDVAFFKLLNIRGSVLLPIRHGIPMSSRIAILVPVDGLFTF